MNKIKMKITHVIIGLNIGGAELMLKRLIDGTESQRGVKHSIISLTDLGVLGKELLASGIEVKYLGMKNAFFLPLVFFKLRQEIKKQQPDLVQTWMYHADILGGLAAKSLKVKRIIWNVRNTNFGLNGFMHKALIKVSAIISKNIPDKIIYVSQSAKLSHERVGYDKTKSIVINNGFDTSKYSKRIADREKVREEFQYNEQDIVILSVGRYAPSKDHLNFIKAAKMAIKQNINIKVLMIGLNVDMYNSKLLNVIGDDISSFYLAGQRNDIPSVFSGVDVFCLHSLTEGFPNVLGEAMSSALPCITTRAGDAELILHDCKYTVDISDAEGLAKVMGIVSKKSSDEKAVMGKMNRQIILENYTIENIRKKYVTLYGQGEK